MIRDSRSAGAVLTKAARSLPRTVSHRFPRFGIQDGVEAQVRYDWTRQWQLHDGVEHIT